MSVSVDKLISVLSDFLSTKSGPKKTAVAKVLMGVKKFAASSSTITREEYIAIPGVGKGMLTRFDEFASTGQLQELISRAEEHKTRRLFEGIYGVGNVLAQRWYEQGYRSLTDIPVSSLTRAQALGIQYYNDINSRIPREEIDEIDVILQRLVEEYNRKYNVKLRAKICGSYLRGRETSGDVDIIISEANDTEFIEKFLAESSGLFKHILAHGDSKVLSLGGTRGTMRRIDLELVKHSSWVYALLYFTGSAGFNKHMRAIAKDRGFLLNHLGIFHSAMEVELESEEEVFAFLNMPFLTPRERDAFGSE